METNDNFEYWILPLIILVSFLLSYFVFINNSNNSSSSKLNIVSNNDNNDNIFVSLNIDDVIENGDFKDCNLISNSNERSLCRLKLSKCIDDDCFLKQGIYLRNEDLCFKIKNIDKKVECSTAVKISKIFEDSILENNITKCDLFEEEVNKQFCKDNFYLSQKYNSGNLDNCNKINSEVMRNECFN